MPSPNHMPDQTAIFNRKSLLLKICLAIMLACAIAAASGSTSAQTEGESGSATLQISQIDPARLPMIELTMWGRDAQGQPLDFSANPLRINHGDQVLQADPAVGQTTVGTFTVFVFDTPTGVEGQFGRIEESVLAFAADPYMVEYTDFVAMYQVGTNGGELLEPPTQFYNGVVNFFSRQIPRQTGPTALLDSLGGILSEMDTLKPAPEMVGSIVVFSDGTDVVSGTYSDQDLISIARSSGTAIHTIVLDNNNLRDSTEGLTRMSTLAQATGGQAAILSEEDLDSMWATIGAFRQQQVVRYELTDIAPGEGIPILAALANDDAVQSGGSVDIIPTAGLLRLAIPQDQRAISAPDLEEGLTLALPGSIGWLDGEDRGLTAVQLWANGEPITEIEPADLETAVVDLPNLRFGANEIWLKAIDGEGQQLSSPIVMLTILQGEQLVIPEALQPPGLSFIVYLILLGAALILASILLWWASMRGLLAFNFGALRRLAPGRGSRRRRVRPSTPFESEAAAYEDYSYMPAPSDSVDPAGFALDLMESITQLASPIGLLKEHVRVGRSSSQSDLVFDQDTTVSRLHATLLREGNTFRIFDENSTSGTYVNSQAVPQYGTLLIDGDEIQLGAVRMRFRIVWDMNHAN